MLQRPGFVPRWQWPAWTVRPFRSFLRRLRRDRINAPERPKSGSFVRRVEHCDLPAGLSRSPFSPPSEDGLPCPKTTNCHSNRHCMY